jgi:hypothetical protein
MPSIEQRFYLLTLNEVFMDEVASIRQKWGIPIYGMYMTDEYMKWKKIPLNKRKLSSLGLSLIKNQSQVEIFSEEMKSLAVRHNFHENYGVYFRNYVLFASKELNRQTFSLVVMPDLSGREGLFLQIWPETKLSDIQDGWNRVLKKQNEMFPKFRRKRNKPSINFERDDEIHRMNLQRLTNEEIAEFINEREDKKAKEAEKSKKIYKKKKGMTYVDVGSIRQKFKKKIKGE